MELDEEEDPEDDIEAELDPTAEEEKETYQLPEEWVFELIEERNRSTKTNLKEAVMENDLDLSSNGEGRSSIQQFRV
jgi:hypothetical protein